MERILIIEDEEHILMALEDDLGLEGYEVKGVSDGLQGFSTAKEEGYDLIVLADHGQHTVEAEDGVRHGTHGTEMPEDIYVPLVWSVGDELKGILAL